tara:strand:+ start:1370 stop:1621 length:252 start_codon:yes stop_codon:yes gene_type:complete
LRQDLAKEQFCLIACIDCQEEGTLYPTTFGLYWKGFIFSCSKHGEILSMDLQDQKIIDKTFHNNTPLLCSCCNNKGEELNGAF